MPELAERLREAESIADPEDYIARVKGSVIAEISSIDASASVEDTHYFNHSAIPDLVMSWAGGRSSRFLYLRDSYGSIVASHDDRRLANRAPLILAYGHEAASESLEGPARAHLADGAGQSRTLVTEPAAFDVLTAHRDDISPLARLVRDNFLSAARGLVDESATKRLTSTDPLEVPAVDEIFTPEVADRIAAAQELMTVALGTDPIPPTLVLHKEQATQILPWLLTSKAVRKDHDFWRAMGEHLPLPYLLKELRNPLEGLALDPLVISNADRLIALRGYLAPGALDPDVDQPSLWSIRAGRLERRTNEAAFIFAANRHLDGAPGTSSATWSDLRKPLRNFRLRSVSLRGLKRDVQLDTERSHDLREDVEQVTQSLEDSYFVDELSISYNDGDETRVVGINLDRRLVLADDGASVAILGSALGRIVAYRHSVEIGELDSVNA